MNRNIVIGGAVAAVIVVVALILIFVPFGAGPSDQEVRQKADQLFVTFREQGGEATYEAVEPEGDGMVLKGLTLKTPAKTTGGKSRTITVEELRIREMDWKDTQNPDFADIEFKNARVEGLKSDPEFQEFSQVTGLEDLVMSGHMKYRVDREKKQVTVEPFRMAVQGMGEYTMTMAFDGVDVNRLRSAAQGGQLQGPQALGLLGAVQLRKLSITYKDDGGTEKFLKFAAKKQNTTPEALRKKTLDQLDGAGQMLKGKLASEAIAAARKFINDPGTIEIVADPAAPVAVLPVVMGAFTGGANPAALDNIKSQLNLSITAN